MQDPCVVQSTVLLIGFLATPSYFFMKSLAKSDNQYNANGIKANLIDFLNNQLVIKDL